MEQRSGANNATVFRSSTIDEMWGSYVDMYADIKKEAAAKGITVPSQPRSKKSFWYRVMRTVCVLKKSQAHGCPICLKGKEDTAELASLKARVESDSDTKEQQEVMGIKIMQLQWDLKYAAFHKTRHHHQRE